MTLHRYSHVLPGMGEQTATAMEATLLPGKALAESVRDCLKTLDNLKPKASGPSKRSKRCSLKVRWTTKI